MLYQTRGIVLRNTRYSDSHGIVRIFTEKLGVQSYLVYGIHSTKSKGRAALYAHGNLLDLTVQHKPNNSLAQVKEASFGYTYTTIPFSVVKSSLLLFCTELLLRSVQEDGIQEELFDCAWAAFSFLDLSTAVLANFHLGFMCDVSRCLGFGASSGLGAFFDLREGFFTHQIPAHEAITQSAEVDALRALIGSDLQDRTNLHIASTTRQKLMQHLLLYFTLHVNGFGKMHSPAILESVFHD